MRVRSYIPEAVQSSIHAHVREAVAQAVEAHESGEEDEDTLTGQLGAFLRTRRPVTVEVQGGTWAWTIGYRKFRGRGPNAMEHIVGADGLFEFTLNGIEQRIKKTCLFQAKSGEVSADLQRLLEQTIFLTTWKEASFVMSYRSDGYRVLSLDEALLLALRRAKPTGTPLDEFLTDSFIACTVGDSELCYEPSERNLRWRDMNGQTVHTSFSARHRFRIKVDGPDRLQYLGARVGFDEIHNHRMEATDEEILGITTDAKLKDVQRARRAKSSIYHTDRLQQLETGRQSIFEMRTKEANAAADRVQERIKREGRRS